LGLRASVLTAALFLIWVCSAQAAPRNHCLDCHPAHYVAQGSCTYCHHGNQQTNRKELAHGDLIAGKYAGFSNPQSASLVAGKKLADQTACRRCHTLAGSGNRLASNLDSLLWTTRPELIRKALVEPALSMPDFHFSAQDRDHLITAILAGGLQAGKAAKEPPQVVHFSDVGKSQENSFTKKCGGCHKLLSKREGGLGSGTAGPNLSGLLTRFYPRTFEGNKPWDEERLKRWLKNPREVRPHAVMRPVMLNATEWEQLSLSLSR
jgi:cytochrome c2